MTMTERMNAPTIRYAAGITILMFFTALFGSYLSYIIPYIALNFLKPGTKMPSFREGLSFVFIVIFSTFTGFLLTKYFHEYHLFFILILGLILFWIFYTDKLSLPAKLFLLIALLADPVPYPGMSTTMWAFLLTKTLISGAVVTIIMVWIVYTIFPDPINKNETPVNKPPAVKPDPKTQLSNALQTFITTFPVVLAFLFYQWEEYLLILIYIVVLTMLPVSSQKAGAVKLFGNLIGGAATIIFYWLLLIASNLSFFILLYFGTALFFAQKIFSKKPLAPFFRTGFSTLTLIIGGAIVSMDEAASEVGSRIVQVMTAVIYVVIMDAVFAEFKKYRRKRNRALNAT